MSASRVGCDIKLTFMLKKEEIYIPDFSLRSDTIHGYKTLNSEFIKTNSDTLLISVFNEKYFTESSKVIIYGERKDTSFIKVKYKDFYLKNKNVQYIRLPQVLCAYNYKILKIVFDNKLLGISNLN